MNNTANPFRFGSKARTLEHLAPVLTSARLCLQIVVPADRWQADPVPLIDEIVKAFAPRLLAVRSSSVDEDQVGQSNAGAYLSVISVEPNAETVTDAIDRVFASYASDGDGQEVLVQPMVENVALSGVVMTRDLDSGAPYYVINYDDVSGRTDTVTGGAISKTVAVHRSNPGALTSPRMRAIIDAARELETLTGMEELDIEFCVTDQTELFVLQVRPLAMKLKWEPLADSIIDDAIDQIRDDLAWRMTPQDGLAGRTTLLGEMPDWNPAEMLGNGRPDDFLLVFGQFHVHYAAEGIL